MTLALFFFAILALLSGLLAAVNAGEAFHGGDNFGAGILFAFCAGLCTLSVIVWLVLAAIHWWPA